MRVCFMLIAICLLMQTNCSAQSNSFSSPANKFLNSLSAAQRKKALYDFGDDERYNWHFVPKKDRKGIRISELSENQKEIAFDLLKLYLSDTGFRKTQEIMQLEFVLQEL